MSLHARHPMTLFRKVPFLTCELSPRKKVKINLSGCNFDCKGCFAMAKQEVGRDFSVEELLEFLKKTCQLVYGGLTDDIQMTGGEPTKNQEYLLSLVRGLRGLGVIKIGMSTNGYMLDEDLVKELKRLAIDYIKLDIKAYSNEIHTRYTGKSNANVLRAVHVLHQHGLNFYVRTIVTPHIVDAPEIEKIARFLGSVDRHILYRLYEFAPEQLDNAPSSKPSEPEMRKASDVARKYLDNVQCFLYKSERTSDYSSVYDPNYKVVEIRANQLLESFKKVDDIARSVDPGWNLRYLTMDEVLSQ
jgi:pyruvate-formate lyase-activating enzyme